ncbi:MAG: YigZ family protein [Bacteroidales bacterium]|nr:YigZ family protein [Bacteroidales bacterium]
MDGTDSYRTIRKASSGLYKEKGSRFAAAAHPVSDESHVKQLIEEVRREHHEARHHCYAYVLGTGEGRWRANDDGEPSGTAGRPILGQIRSAGLTNVLVIVSRYFGGTLLGVSGLINAYRTAARSALDNAEIIEETVQESHELRFPYAALNDVMKIIKEEEAAHSGQIFDLECRMTVSFRISARERILQRLSRIEGLHHAAAEEK